MVRESYYGSPRAASLARSSILDDHLRSDPYWSEWNLSPGLCLWKQDPKVSREGGVLMLGGQRRGSQVSAPRSLQMME